MSLPSPELPSSESTSPAESSVSSRTSKRTPLALAFWSWLKRSSRVRPSADLVDLLQEMVLLSRSIEHLASALDARTKSDAEFKEWLREKIPVWIVQLASTSR